MSKHGQSPAILLTCFHSYHNAGDYALLLSTLEQLRRAFDRPRLSVLMNHPESEELARQGVTPAPAPFLLLGVGRKPVALQLIRAALSLVWLLLYRLGLRGLAPAGWRALFDLYRDSDLVLGVPGNQMYATGRFGWPLPASLMPVFLAHVFRKPFYVMPQSIGPFKRGWERTLLRRLYGQARHVFLRDQISIDLAKDIRLPDAIVSYAPDPAFSLPPAPLEQALEVLRRYGFQPGRPSLGVTVIAGMGRSLDPLQVAAYRDSLCASLERFARQTGARIYFFIQVSGPTAVENDRIPSLELVERLRNAGVQAELVDEELRPALLKACYGQMDLFVASRLHSAIFALGMGVPVVCVGYLTKTRGMLQKLGLDAWVIDLRQVSEAGLTELIARAWRERAALRARIATLMPVVAQQTWDAGALIAADFARGRQPHG